MVEMDEKKTAPIPSATTDVEQPSQKNTTDIIPNKNALCNMSPTKTGKITGEYITQRIIQRLDETPESYPRNDIGISKLFFEVFENKVVYVQEPKCWYIYKGDRWVKDDGNLLIMETVKMFAICYARYALTLENDEITKFALKLCSRAKREGIMKDACSIAPKSLSRFDENPHLFNCKNGTYNLKSNKLQSHNPTDYITKISNVTYDETAICHRWVSFISEIMEKNRDNEQFLQKAFGYALSGETDLECFFIFYGSTTRNGKSTACESVSYALGEYATHAQAKTVARNNRDGSSATPDIARLKGARFVIMAEPEKGLEIDVSLIKQLTGGDKYTGRFLNENPTEFQPEFKIFINTNHLPRVNDDTIFSSERVKILPFERHFNPSEQDTGLKESFKREEMLSGIFNWLVEGYILLKAEGLTTTASVMKATQEYREESDTIGLFLKDTTFEVLNSRVQTSNLYRIYKEWCSNNGYRPLNVKNFIGEMRSRYDVKRSGANGNEVVGIELLPPNCPW